MKKTIIFMSAVFTALLAAVICAQLYICPKEMSVSADFSGGRTSAEESDYFFPEGTISLKVRDERTVILQNGVVPEYEENDDIRTYTVHDGDVFHMDMRNADKEGIIYVYDTSENVQKPSEATKMHVTGGVKKLFEVKVAGQSKKDS